MRLRDAGCVLSRHGGNHGKWTNPKTGVSQFVPRHSGEVPTGLANKILRDLVGVSPNLPPSNPFVFYEGYGLFFIR